VALTYLRSGTAGHAASAATLVIRGFEATVYQGPDKGLSLVGTLTVQYDRTGALTGRFDAQQGQAVPVSGQFTDAAINLIFYLGQGKHIFGVGTFGQEPGHHGWFVGDPLVGPSSGDSGDWLANYCDRHPHDVGCDIRPTAD
jgi:hypothetical protein